MAGSTVVDAQGRVAEIVGEGNVTRDPAGLASYFADQVDPKGLAAASPGTTEEVQKIVEVCQETGTPIFTTYETHFSEEVASWEGILIDFSRMNRIERIDSKNLCVHVERGVTFEQLEKALAAEGLTALVPAGARTRSVVCHTVSRGMNLAASKYPEVQASNMKVVLQDGRIHLTGGHAISEETSDWKEDGGPNLSKWYLGADDIFGLVVRASIWIYPRFEGRSFEMYGFSDSGEALDLLKELPRLDLTAECLVMNRAALAARLDASQESLPPWALVVGVEAFPELADYRSRKVREAVDAAGGRVLGAELQAGLTTVMQRPWYIENGAWTSYHTLFKRIPEFETILTQRIQQADVASESVGRTYIAHGLGRAVCCQYDFSGSGGKGAFVEDLEIELASAGAFYDRPQGRLAEHIYGTVPAYVSQMKRIKDTVDERRIFNPGRPVKEV